METPIIRAEHQVPISLACVRLRLASFPDLPAHPQTLYARLFFYPLNDKKIIAHIMFAGEREGLGTRLATPSPEEAGHG